MNNTKHWAAEERENGMRFSTDSECEWVLGEENVLCAFHLTAEIEICQRRSQKCQILVSPQRFALNLPPCNSHPWSSRCHHHCHSGEFPSQLGCCVALFCVCAAWIVPLLSMLFQLQNENSFIAARLSGLYWCENCLKLPDSSPESESFKFYWSFYLLQFSFFTEHFKAYSPHWQHQEGLRREGGRKTSTFTMNTFQRSTKKI